MKLKGKLLSAFLTIIGFFTIVSVITIFISISNNSIITNTKEIILENTISAIKLQKDIIQIQQWFSDISATRGMPGYDDGLIKAEEYFNSANSIIENLMEAPENADKKDKIEFIKYSLSIYYELGTAMANAYIKGGPDLGNLLMDDFDKKSIQLNLKIQEFVDFYKDELLIGSFDKIITQLDITFWIISIPIIVIIIFAVFISTGISNSLSDKIQKIAETAHKMANRDLTGKNIINTKDEIGKLSKDINESIDMFKRSIKKTQEISNKNKNITTIFSEKISKTHNSIYQISENINNVNEQFQVLTNSINTSSSSIEEISSVVGNLSNQITNQASAVEQTSASIEEMSASINNVSKITKQRKKAVVELRSVTLNGSDKVDTTNQIISDIARKIDDMQEMITIINAISSQTNLLAMNAAIEAAHAGEFGKGFAVVADEITKLADSTSSNAGNIAESLNDIIEKIQLGLSSSEESGEAFLIINKQVDEVVNTFDEISTSSEELLNGSLEILNATTNLLNITEEIKNGSSEIKAGVDEINSSMTSIKEITNENNNKMKVINSKTDIINSDMSKISDLVQENINNVDTLNEELLDFKTDED